MDANEANGMDANGIDANGIDANGIDANGIDANGQITEYNTERSWKSFPQYLTIVNEFLTNFTKSTKFTKPADDNQFLLIHGVSTITHVFRITLQQSANYQLAIDNMQKSIYYYIPFMEQMEENSFHDLTISSNNAAVFIYKKTIGDFNLSLQENISDAQRDFVINIESLIRIYRCLFELIEMLSVAEIIIYTTSLLKELCKKQYKNPSKNPSKKPSKNPSKKNKTEQTFKEDLSKVMLLFKHLLNEPIAATKKYEIIYMYIKKNKFLQPLSIEGLCKKKTDPNYYTKLKECNINWLIV